MRLGVWGAGAPTEALLPLTHRLGPANEELQRVPVSGPSSAAGSGRHD